jgi:hypothetical protein
MRANRGAWRRAFGTRKIFRMGPKPISCKETEPHRKTNWRVKEDADTARSLKGVLKERES